MSGGDDDRHRLSFKIEDGEGGSPEAVVTIDGGTINEPQTDENKEGYVSFRVGMRIKDDGKYEWRREQYAEAAGQLGENTKSRGIDAATAFTIEMLSNLERAMEDEDMTPELAEILSTD